MSWRVPQNENRAQWLRLQSPEESLAYHEMLGVFDQQELEAWGNDLAEAFPVIRGSGPLDCLDAGAGTGAISQLLQSLGSHRVQALEPAAEMLEVLRSRSDLREVRVQQGFCDHVDDRDHFPEASFDLIVSRQLANGLWDPLAAFANWHHWLKPSGTVLLIDGFYGRDAWRGEQAGQVDQLPLAAQQSLALVPYLLEKSGFRVLSSRLMPRVNQLPRTRTTRYLVVAQRV